MVFQRPMNHIFSPYSLWLVYSRIPVSRYSSTTMVYPQLLSFIWPDNCFKQLCHGLCFRIRVLFRETLAIIVVMLSTSILFSLFSYLRNFSKRKIIYCSATQHYKVTRILLGLYLHDDPFLEAFSSWVMRNFFIILLISTLLI